MVSLPPVRGNLSSRQPGTTSQSMLETADPEIDEINAAPGQPDERDGSCCKVFRHADIDRLFRLAHNRRYGKPRLPPAKRAQITAALKDHPNAKQVARQLGGVSDGTVWNIAKAAGIELAALG